MTPSDRHERGSATAHVLTVAMVTVVAAVVVLHVAALVVVKHRAASAADLAAVAGATRAASGADGCLAAASVAQANQARLVRCAQADVVLTVAVEARSPSLWGRRWSVERTARAAPHDWEVEP